MLQDKRVEHYFSLIEGIIADKRGNTVRSNSETIDVEKEERMEDEKVDFNFFKVCAIALPKVFAL